MNGNQRMNRTSREPGGIRIRFVLIGGAVLLLPFYLAFRQSNPTPASASSDSVTPPPPQSVVMAERQVTRPAVVPANPPRRQHAPAPLPAPSLAPEVIARVTQAEFYTDGVSPQK